MGYNYEILIKLGYAALLGFSLYCLVLSIKLGYMSDKTGTQLNPVLYIMYVIIFGLCIIQSYQCLLLLFGPITAMWWVPFFCKHLSLWTYWAILKFMDWRHFIDADSRDNEATCIPTL